MRRTIAALENSLARKSDPELLADLQKRAATLGLQITHYTVTKATIDGRGGEQARG